jgi:cycloeucalenol cycloisomerase
VSGWLSSDPGKAWAEKFFLLYSPVWMAQMGAVMALGLSRGWGDLGYLVQALLVAAPLVVVPALLSPERAAGRAWHQTAWLKLNLWIAVFAFVGNYFGSEYFFDVLGMIYRFPVRWNLDSALLGSGEQRVPIALYLLTQAYFMTYHVSAVVVLRRIRRAFPRLPALGFALVVLVIAYFWAWAETRAMANPWIADRFQYQDLPRMLAFGSLFYACYFVVSFPLFARVAEREGEPWPLGRVVLEALAAGMLVLFLLDFWARWIGPL